MKTKAEIEPRDAKDGQQTPRSQERPGTDSPSQALRKNQPYRHLDLGLLPSSNSALLLQPLSLWYSVTAAPADKQTFLAILPSHRGQFHQRTSNSSRF